MKKAYFTFGQSHAHSVNGFTYDKDIVVEIETEEDPRSVMCSYFGNKWAFEYKEKPEMEYFPRGIKKLS